MTARPSRTPAGPKSAAAASAPPGPSALATRPAWQQHLIALVGLWLVFACVFPEITLQGQILSAPDFESASSFGVAGRAAMQAGEYPLWNPYLFLGMPTFGSLTFTPYVYPPAELLAAFGKLPGVPPLAWLVFYYLAAGYGVYLLLRSRDVGLWPALVAGACFMLLPHLVAMGVFGQGSKLASVAHLPYLALLGLRLRQPGRRALWIAILALAVGLLLLRSHPQVAFYGLAMLGLLGLFEIVGAFRDATPRAEIGRYAASLVGAVVLGFGLAAVLLLPVHAYAPVSIRGAAAASDAAAYQYATNWSFSGSEIATFFLPSAEGFGEATYVGTMPFTNFPNYLGVAVLLFGVAALVSLRGRLVWFWLTLGLAALAVSFGRNFPLFYDLLYRHMPFFSKFRVPVMILVLQQLSACVLLGLGLSALSGRLPRGLQWRQVPTRREVTRFAIAAGVAAVLVLVLVQPWSSALAQRVGQNPRLPVEARALYGEVARRLLQADGLRIGFLLAVQATIVVLWWRRRLPTDVAGLALLLCTAIDLGVVDRKMVTPQKTWPGVEARLRPKKATLSPPGPVAQFLLAQPSDGRAPVRILPPGEGFMNNDWMRWGIASAGGYHPAKLSRYEDLVETSRRTLAAPLLDLFAVRYIVVPQRLERAAVQPVYEGADGVVYENTRAMPRAWVTGAYEVARSGDACKARLLAPDFEYTHVALLESEPSPKPDPTAQGQATIAAFSSNHVALDVTSSAPGLMVLAEAFHPGWRATVNGAPTPVVPADCVLRAVAVAAGTSRIELQFVDPAMRRGRTVTLASLAVVLALVLVGVWRRPAPGATLLEAQS